MNLNWQISESDVQKLREFVEPRLTDAFVQHRFEHNVDPGRETPVKKDEFWHAMVSCLLTTQQRSGPHTPVNKLISTSPFPLGYRLCRDARNVEKLVEGVLKKGSIRRWRKIGEEVGMCLGFLEGGGWKETLGIANALIPEHTVMDERQAAQFIDENLRGFGPKQSRNLLQSLGLTQYEIPIDSRITTWLNKFGFPMALSSDLLSNADYYNFLSDGLQELCRRSDLYPCVVDAAIFSSFDGDKWSEVKIVL